VAGWIREILFLLAECAPSVTRIELTKGSCKKNEFEYFIVRRVKHPGLKDMEVIRIRLPKKGSNPNFWKEGD
jgi:hypothetical protein